MACPDPFLQHGRHCYYFSDIADSNSHRDWFEAGIECEELGAKRLAIETEEEQSILIEIWKNLTGMLTKYYSTPHWMRQSGRPSMTAMSTKYYSTPHWMRQSWRLSMTAFLPLLTGL
jgi:hypothetical protein